MSRRNTIRLFTALFLLGLTAGWLAAPVRADLTISAAPSLLEVSATPGGVGVQEITVSNAGTEPFPVSAEPIQYKDGGGELSAVAWLKVEPSSFQLSPGQRQTVKATVSVPANADSGSRYAMIAFRTSEKSSEGTVVGVAAQVGVPFLITVKGAGPITRQPALGGVTPVLEPGGGLGLRAIIENRGNTHVYARGSVQFNDSTNRPWGRLVLRDSTAILPGTRELLYSDQSIPFKDGETYKARAEISFGEGSPEVREIEFTATSKLEIVDLAPRPSSTGGLDVTMTLKNSGNLGLLPRLPMAIRNEEGKIVGVLSPEGQPSVWPAQTVDVVARYPGRLAPGRYALVARAEYGPSSLQVEQRFEISASAAPASVPVTKWAQGPAIQPPEVAGAKPETKSSAPEASGLWAAAYAALAPVGLFAVFGAMTAFGLGLVLMRRRRGPSAYAPRMRPRITIEAPKPPSFGLTGQLLRRKRPRPTRSAMAAMLPPPQVLYLPSPSADNEEEIEWLSPAEAPLTAMPEPETVARNGNGYQSGMSIREPQIQKPVDRSTKESDRRTSSGLSRAVAEKAAALAAEAGRAAQLGDRAAVDRLSRQALQLDPWNIDAWLWLSASCEDRRSALMCLEAVLLLEPSNQRAKRGFAALSAASNGDGKQDGGLWEVVADGRHGDTGPVDHRSN